MSLSDLTSTDILSGDITEPTEMELQELMELATIFFLGKKFVRI